METVRLLLALAAKWGWQVHHLNVKTAFLNGDLNEDVYVIQPTGFVEKGKENMVYKLKKALYGLKQAPRAWNVKLHKTLVSLGFVRCKMEHVVYKRENDKGMFLLGVYVDDLIITGSSLAEIEVFKNQMKEAFEMNDLGLLSYYLGLEVEQSDCGISLKQSAYVTKFLKENRMWDANSTVFPMDPEVTLCKDEKGAEVDATRYRRIVGCLRYITHTRPDLSYAVGMVSRYMAAPKVSHMQAVKQILRYLKGTVDCGLFYGRHGSEKLVGYSDSSFAMDRDDGKSTTGTIFYYGGGPVTWGSQKQRTVALSSCEAEFMAATAAACEAVWLKGVLEFMTSRDLGAVVLKVDNKSAIELMKKPVFQGKSKHINTRYHFIRESVEQEQIAVEFVQGTEQKAAG